MAGRSSFAQYNDADKRTIVLRVVRIKIKVQAGRPRSANQAKIIVKSANAKPYRLQSYTKQKRTFERSSNVLHVGRHHLSGSRASDQGNCETEGQADTDRRLNARHNCAIKHFLSITKKLLIYSLSDWFS